MNKISKYAGYFTLCMATFPMGCLKDGDNRFVSSSELTEEIMRGVEKEKDFTLVRRLHGGQLKSLEKILEGEEYEFNPKGDLQVDEKKSIGIVQTYLIESITSTEEERIATFNLKSKGTGFVFSNDGYLLLTYHQINSIVNSSNGGVLLFSDPSRNIIRKVDLLSYSKINDLALGKIDIPDGIYEDRPILTSEPVHPNPVYSTILNNVSVDNDLVVKYLENQNLANPSWYNGGKKAEFIISAGRIINYVNDMSGNRRNTFGQRGYYREVNFKEETTQNPNTVRAGNSGSPVFTNDNKFCGIVTAINDPDKSDPNIVFFAGPTAIRALINDYMNKCKK